MKKIIWTFLLLSLWFIGYSTSLYLDDINQCSSSWPLWWCNSSITITSQCLQNGNKLSIPYTKNNKAKTWSVLLCDWQVYWGTWRISRLWCYAYKNCCEPGSVVITGWKCKRCDSLSASEYAGVDTSNCAKWCDTSKQYSLDNWLTVCCDGILEDNVCQPSLWEYWINLNEDCLLDWQCGLNVYKLLWIRKSDENPTVMWFFQDITIASTTVILWTVLVIAMVIGWLSRSFASITGKDTKKWKTILISSFVWMLLVMWSYAIIRLIQFLALAWS